MLDAQGGRSELSATPAAPHGTLVEVEVAGEFRLGDGGAVVFGFGRHAGRPLTDVARTAPDDLTWALTRPFLADGHELVRAARVAARARARAK